MKPITVSLAEGVARNAYAPAICAPGTAWTYAALAGMTARAAQRIAACGVAPGTLVYLDVEGEERRFLTALAAIHMGLVPIWIRHLHELAVSVTPGFTIAAADPAQRIRPGAAANLVIDYAALASERGDVAFPPWVERADDALYIVGASSGTTGRPKPFGVAWGQARRRHAIATHQHYAPGSRVMSTVGPLVYYGFSTQSRVLAAGACIVRASDKPLQSLSLINLFAVDTLLTVPQQITIFMDLMQRHGIRCPTLRRIALTASLFPRELLARIESMFDAEVRVIYGTSEAGPVSTAVVTSRNFEPGDVGELLPGLELEAESDNPDQPGALTFVNSSRTLWDAWGPDGREPLPADARQVLPDLGSRVGNRLYLAGRSDEVFNHSGNKVAFSRIEAALRRHLPLAEVAVVQEAGPGEQRLVVAYVVREGAAAPTPDDVWATLRERLPGLATAGDLMRFVPMPQIPHNAAGKVDRDAVLAARSASSATSH